MRIEIDRQTDAGEGRERAVLEIHDGSIELWGFPHDFRHWIKQLKKALGAEDATVTLPEQARVEAEDWCVHMLRDLSGDESFKLAAGWLEQKIRAERGRRESDHG